jgi:hypothetical protein
VNKVDPSGLDETPPKEKQEWKISDVPKTPAIWNPAGANEFGSFHFLFSRNRDKEGLPSTKGMAFAVRFSPTAKVKDEVAFIQVTRTTQDKDFGFFSAGHMFESTQPSDRNGWHVDNTPGRKSGWFGRTDTGR